MRRNFLSCRPLFRLFLPLLLLSPFAVGCGSDISTQEWQGAKPPGEAIMETGAGWKPTQPVSHCATPLPSPNPSSSPSPLPSPAPSTSPVPVPTPTSSPSPQERPAWCKVFPWGPKCRAHHGLAATFAAGTDSDCNPTEIAAPAIHNTTYCRVNDAGQILSDDQIRVVEEGDVVHSITGGCIARPIREVWALFLNHGLMRPDDVDQYDPKARQDLVPNSPDNRIEFVFDLYNVHHAVGGLVNPDWTVRWFHAVPYGDYASPNQLVINFQKIEGTSHIRLLRGGYVLDRTTDSVTSYAMEQWADADRYGTDKATYDMNRNFERLRQGAPNWAALPATPPVVLPKR